MTGGGELWRKVIGENKGEMSREASNYIEKTARSIGVLWHGGSTPSSKTLTSAPHSSEMALQVSHNQAGPGHHLRPASCESFQDGPPQPLTGAKSAS